MQRIGLAALALGVAAMSAGAEPLSLDSHPYPPSDSRALLERPYLNAAPHSAAPAEYDATVQPRVWHVQAPAPRHAARQYTDRREPDLGGGFIEFLFGGLGDSRQRQPIPAPPVTEPVPAPVERIYAPPPAASPPSPRTASLPPARTVRPAREMDPKFLPTIVDYSGKETPGTIIINTNERFLYLVMEGGMAKRYGIGVGRPGFTWAGTHTISAKKEWPDWRPPEQMLKRQPYLPHFMPGGPENPLGARALYLGSTLYRIHGSNEPWTIGRAVSSGCIRMRNQDVIDLYDRVGVGTKVVVI